MKATDDTARFMQVQTGLEDSMITVTIQDHGHGIPVDRLHVIFNPFYSTKASGLGMGLSICRRIIENHSGSIEAFNHENGGATFRFELPVAVAASE
jgi:signal transduction histidine kinase